jgi:PAS domain S-box-containing protein
MTVSQRGINEPFWLVADIAPIPIWMSDASQGCTYVNKPWLTFTGRTLEAELGDGWRDSIHPDDLPRLLAVLTASFERREPFKVEYRLRRHDGEYRWMLDSGMPQLAPDGALTGYVGSCVDVNDLKHAQAELAYSTERLRLALESGRSLAWEWDLKADRDTCFGDLQTILGMADNTFVGTIGTFRNGLHPDDRDRVLKAIDEAERHRTMYEEEFRVRWADGTVRWVASKGRAYYSEDGTATRMLGVATDITARKQAEESLRRKESELMDAQRLAAIGSWQWDQDTGEVVWSKELYRIVGLEPGSMLDARNHSQLYPEAHWERLVRVRDEAMRSGTPYELDVQMLKADGTPRWVTARGEVQRDAHGRISGLRGTVQDITERKHREQSLGLFRSLLDRSNDSLEIVDPRTFRFLDVNDQACRDLGYSREELLSLTVQDVDPNANGARLKEIAKLCQQAGFAMVESVHRRKDGSVFPVEVNIKPVTLDDRLYYVSVCRNITERKEAQQALRESEERLRLAAEAGNMFAYTWDPSTDEIIRSGESSHILGIDAALPVTGQEILARIHPDDRDRVLAVLGALTPAHPQLQMRYRMNRPDGSTIWVERCSRAYFDAAGRLVRIVGMVADITQRKLAEEVLSSVSQRLLEAQEAERARIARELHDDISQRLALLSVGFEQLQRSSPDSASALRGSIDALHRQTLDIASDVQALSHELHSSKLQVLGVVPAMRGFCSEIAERQKVDVDFTYESVPRTVPPDVALCLFRVLQEALRNAVRHSSARRFAVNLVGTSSALGLTVRDAGRGFDPDRALQDGGLGLTSMRERLKLVAGELSIESRPAGGTTIVARVPLSTTVAPSPFAEGRVG